MPRRSHHRGGPAPHGGEPRLIVAVLGPTASGKTPVAIEVALAIDAEVISVDSMQVYRGMDIGTAKPSLEEKKGVTHHMIDLVDPADEFSVARFAASGRRIIEHAERPLVIVGGSGLHFRALVDPLTFPPTDPATRRELEALEMADLREAILKADPRAGSHVDLDNSRRMVRALEILELTGQTPSARAATPEADAIRSYRPVHPFTAFGTDPESLIEERIDQRLAAMRAAGLVEEVERLWGRMGRTARTAVNYRQIGEHLEGRIGLEEALGAAARATRRLARRQRTWFQRDPRVQWIPWSPSPAETAARIVEAL